MVNKKIHAVILLGIIGIVVIIGTIFLILDNRNAGIPGNPDDDGFFTEESTINGKTGNKDNPVIPEGFRPVNTESAKWEGGANGPTAEAVSNGLVIEDKNLNQFVWIPVTYTEFQRYEGYYDGELDSFLSHCGEADSAGENTNSQITESSVTETESKEMYASVRENGGFYVGRFEAGKENGNVVVKQEADVFNHVTWSKNGGMNEEIEVEGTEDNPDGAIELARNFDTLNGYTNVTSTLMYGVQWDAVMQWMDPAYKEESCDLNDSYVANSEGEGYYTPSAPEAPTKTGYYGVNNVYDLAGNVYEWTMESFDTDSRINRGGNYYSTGTVYPASSRNANVPSMTHDNFGFRIALYLDN